MSKYTPKQFSPRVYPEWGELLEDLTPEKQAEILSAIIKYPNENPSGGVWKFIKSQIDKDYEEFVERNKAHQTAIKNYWGNKGKREETKDNICSPLLNKSEQKETKENKEEQRETYNINININEEHKQELKKNKQKEKISFSDVSDWESLFTYWEENKKGKRYKNEESRQRMFNKLKELTNNDFNLAKLSICHAIDNDYQGFCNGSELFYKPPKGALPEFAEDRAKRQQEEQERLNRIFGEN